MSDPGLLNAEPVASASPPSFLTAFPDHISGRLTPPGPSAEEMTALKAELAAAQRALQEATDAREASETAVRALREFIAENAVGMANSGAGAGAGSEGLQGLRLPPLPTDADVADEEASGPRKVEEPKRGWGGWLKRETSNSAPKAAPAPPPASVVVPVAAAPSIKSVSEEEEGNVPPATTPLTSFVSTWTRSVSSSSSTGVATPPIGSDPSPISPAVPQQSGFRKFSFFSKTAPVVATASAPSSQTQTQFEPEPEEAKHIPAPLQLQREGSVRDSVSSASVSDAIEPVSPPAEMVDVVLDRGRFGGGKEEYPGERTPTVGSVTGFAM